MQQFYHTSVSVDMEVKTQSTQFCFKVFSPPNESSAFSYSRVPSTVSLDEEASQPGLVWFGSSVSNQWPCGLSPGAVRHWLAFCSKCPKAKKVSICFCFSLMSLQSYSKQKQQGSILTADLIGGRGFCVLAALWSPLTWSRPNHNRPEKDMQWSTS